MSVGEEEFEAAAAFVGSLAAAGSIDDNELLNLYGLYKQATTGSCSAPKPSFFDMKGRAKRAAWATLGDMEPSAAAAQYIETLKRLRPEWSAPAAGKKAAGAGGPVFSSLAHDDDDLEPHDGSTPLIEAASRGDVEVVRQLLREGQHPNQRDSEGCSALHWAADRGHEAVIAELILAKADLDAEDGDGMTPCHYASVAERRAAAKQLVAAGADAAKRSREGETARELAPQDWTDVF